MDRKLPATSAQATHAPEPPRREVDVGRGLALSLVGVGALITAALFFFLGFRAVTGYWPDSRTSMNAFDFSSAR